MEKDIVEFIAKKSKVPVSEISLEATIYNSALLSSLALLELMSFIEKKYNITVDADELVENNFKDIRAIVNFIKGKLSLNAGLS